jgi:VanZ family protein
MTANVTPYRAGLALGRFCRYILPLCLWMGFIFVMSTRAGSARVTTAPLLAVLAWLWPDVASFSSDQSWVLVFLFRKLGHIAEYLILTLLLVRAVQQDSPLWNWRSAVLALLFAVLHGFVDEWHQSFVPSRTADVRDVLVDSMGVLLALGIAWAWYRGRQHPADAWERLARLRQEGFLTEEEFRAAKARLTLR